MYPLPAEVPEAARISCAVASLRCSPAPRRNACDSEARVIIRKPKSAIVLPVVPSPAWMPVISPAAEATS